MFSVCGLLYLCVYRDTEQIDVLTNEKANLIVEVSHLTTKVHEMTLLHCAHDSSLTRYKAEQEIELTRRDRAISEIQKCVSSRDLQISQLKKERDSFQAQIGNLQTQKLNDDLRLQGEIEALTKSLANAQEEFARKLNAESSQKSLAVSALRAELKDTLDLNAKLSKQLVEMKHSVAEMKKEVQNTKFDANRRISSGGSEILRLESQCTSLQKQLDKSVKAEEYLQEEVDNLLHQQELVIEETAMAKKTRDFATDTIRDVNEKIKLLVAKEKKYETTSNQLKELRAKFDSTKSQLLKADLSKNSLESKLSEAHKNVIRFSVLSALIMWIIARLVA